jgi:hypothetical protein
MSPEEAGFVARSFIETGLDAGDVAGTIRHPDVLLQLSSLLR